MFAVTRALEEALLQHFRYTKLDIAYAINKPFPFFEALRDNSFITENMYKESLEACQNMVPLSKVVHKVLTSLEKTFHMSLLQTLFSRVNLREYPSMEAIFRSFKNVAVAYERRNTTTQTLVEVPNDPAEGRSLQALPPPPSQPPPPSHPSSATRACNPRASSQQTTETLGEKHGLSHPAVPLPGFIQEEKTTPAPSNNLTATTNKKEHSERMPSPSPGTVQVSSRHHQREDKEDSQETTPSPSGPVSGVKDDSLSANDLEMPQEAAGTPANKKAKNKRKNIWSTPKKKQKKKRTPQGVASPGHGVQKELKVLVQRTLWKNDSTRNLKEVTSTRKARSKCAQTPRSQELSNEASKTNSSRRPQKRHSIPPRTRHKKSEDDTVDFLSPALPVTCGKAKGILFKEKLKQGSSEKCIQNEAGAWLTPKEFLMQGERSKSKDWKKAIHCKAKTLRFLEEKGLLPCTSKKKTSKQR